MEMYKGVIFVTQEQFMDLYIATLDKLAPEDIDISKLPHVVYWMSLPVMAEKELDPRSIEFCMTRLEAHLKELNEKYNDNGKKEI